MNSCPSATSFEKLLSGHAADDEVACLRQHLANCTACQTLLDRLTDHPELRQWAGDEDSSAVDSEVTVVTGDDTVGASPWPQIPDYQILAELGRGGMGVVYQARHQRLNRIVALKMILAGGHASSEEHARFLAEAKAVAQLQHPNVVQLFEYGQHDGRPYITLEFVAGGSLATRLNGRPLPPRAAAQLVEQLAHAVHYAHQHGIVHRDLKPSNVLLTEDAIPKVTDFGLAKRVEASMVLTAPGVLVGTPSYVAPEQARADRSPVGPAADTYALGAILYECLTGRPPFQGVELMDTLAQVVNDEPVPPRRLQPHLDRDLETICLKCLQKEPRKRYASALALAEDLGRFLAKRPIRARPVGRVEHAWRWCRRQPLAAGLLTGMVVVVTASIIALAVLWLRADEQRRLAVANAEESERQRVRYETSYRLAREGLEQCVTKVAEDPRLKKGPMEDLRRVALQAEVLFYQKFLELRGDEAAFQVERGRTYKRLAHVTAELASKQEAADYYGQALAIFEKLVAASPGVPDYQFELVSCYLNLGLQLDAGDRLTDAEQYFADALRLAQNLRQEQAGEPRFADALARVHLDQGIHWNRLARTDDAERAFRAALTIFQTLVRDHPAEPAYQDGLAAAYVNLGWLYGDVGRTAQAELAYRDAIRLRQTLVHNFPNEHRYQGGLALCYQNLGVLLQLAGRTADAEQVYRDALAIMHALAVEHAAVVDYHAKLARIQYAFGHLYQTTGRSEEAKQAYDDGLARLALLAHGLLGAECRAGLAAIHVNLANLHQAAGRARQADDCVANARTLVAALARDQRGVDEEAVYTLSTCWLNCGHQMRDNSRLEAALTCYEQALATIRGNLQKHAPPPRLRTVLKLVHWGRMSVLTRLGRYTDALAECDEAIASDDGTHREELAFIRAATLARLGDHTRATAEAEKFARAKEAAPAALYRWAGVYALASSAVRQDAALGSEERALLVEAHAARAMELLRQVDERGGFANAANRALLATEPNLEPLRNRKDFQSFLRALERR